MQGAFPVAGTNATGTDWGGILNPGPDEQSMAEQRRHASEEELNRIRQVRRAAAADEGVPDPQPVSIPVPQPPSSRFQVRGTWVYIVREIPNLPLRPGIWGHYLVTYERFQGDDDDETWWGRPYKDRQELDPPVKVHIGAPGTVKGDTKPPPSPDYCIENEHYVCAGTELLYYEIGMETLRQALEQGEALDLAFARRMEGLGNVAKSAVWDCLDPDYNPGDRKAVMEQFMHKYLDRFYTRLQPGNVPTAGDVAEEALHKHKAFCKAWTQKHYKTLTPVITAPAETLTSEFYPFIESSFPRDRRLTREELARMLMRHQEFSADFATCLHYYTTSLEQSRGGRNASYKQMTQISAARAWSYNRMGNALAAKRPILNQFFHSISDLANFWFHPTLIDWYGIMGQIPQVHRYFDDEAAQNGPAPRMQNGGIVPPWRFAR